MQQLLPLVCMLACPVGMGLMWWMMRDNKGQGQSLDSLPSPDKKSLVGLPTAKGNPEERVALLKARLDLMKSQQANLTDQMEQIASENEKQLEKSGEAVNQEQRESISR